LIFEVLTAVKILIFWVVILCGFVGRYQHLRESPEDGDEYISLKLWYLPTSPHGVTTQQTDTDKDNINTGKARTKSSCDGTIMTSRLKLCFSLSLLYE
jgi:hypothetical protein